MLSTLGPRICILGQSGAGKSTLAVAIGDAIDSPVVHLDQLRHLPGTHFELRDDAAFAALHSEAVAGERWVMEGNYSALWPARADRATGVILLEVSTLVSLRRYATRALRTWRRRDRAGGLGVRERYSHAMVMWIVRHSGRNRTRRRAMAEAAAVPTVVLSGTAEIAGFLRDLSPAS